MADIDEKDEKSSNLGMINGTCDNSDAQNQDESNVESTLQMSTKFTVLSYCRCCIKRKEKKSDEKMDNLRKQLRYFKRKLNADNTILSKLPCCLSKPVSSFPTSILSLLLLLSSLLYLLGDIKGISSLGFIYTLIATIVFFITIIVFILHCNCEIALEALKSFLVWYKVVHACIGITSRMVFEGFYITPEQEEKNQGWSNEWLYFRAILVIINITLGVFGISALDGFHSSFGDKCMKKFGINDKRNYFKIIVSIVGILILANQWLSLYTNRNNRNIYNSIHVTLFDNKEYDFYWRNIALSSYSKVLAFLVAQLYHNIRHFDRINIVPQPALVHYFEKYDHRNHRAQSIVQSKSGVTSPNRRRSYDLTPNTKNDVQHGLSSKPNDLSPQDKQQDEQQVKSSVKKPALHQTTQTLSGKNANVMLAHGGTRIDSDDDDAGQETLDVHVGMESRHRELSSISQMSQSVMKIRSLLGERHVLDNEELTRKLNALNFEMSPHELSHRALDDDERKKLNENKHIVLDLKIEATVFYWICRKIFCFNRNKAARISELLNRDRTELFFVCIGFFFAILRNFIEDISIVLMCDIIAFISCLVILFNLNYVLLYFKRRSLILYWKCYNIITMYAAIYYLEYQENEGFFQNKNKNIQNANIANAVFLILIVFCCAYFISLSQGMMWYKWIKIVAVLFMIGFVSRQGIEHFVRQNYDYQVPFILNENFSLRAIIVSKSFDLVIWFTYQLIQIWRHPQRINLISKIEIIWQSTRIDEKMQTEITNASNISDGGHVSQQNKHENQLQIEMETAQWQD